MFSTSKDVVDAVSSTFLVLRDVAEAPRSTFFVSSEVELFPVSTGSLFSDSVVDTFATSLLKKTAVRSLLFFDELSTELARRISSNSVECRRSEFKVRSSDFVVLSSYFRLTIGSFVVVSSCCGDEICVGVSSAKVTSLSTSGGLSTTSFGLLRRRHMSLDSLPMAEFVDKI